MVLWWCHDRDEVVLQKNYILSEAEQVLLWCAMATMYIEQLKLILAECYIFHTAYQKPRVELQ